MASLKPCKSGLKSVNIKHIKKFTHLAKDDKTVRFLYSKSTGLLKAPDER